MNRIATWRLIFLAVAFVISGIVGLHWGDELRLSEAPSNYIGVTFSILAAALFAVISIVGDPSMLLPGNWRVGWESAKSIQARLQRFNYLFLWYLLTLGLLIVSEIVEHAKWEDYYFIFNVLSFFSTFGFIVSLALPFELSKIQKDRLEQEIRQRKPKP
ncbi:MAG: hypothetical protein Kow0032_22800 [Methyloligellaceae bacterium]